MQEPENKTPRRKLPTVDPTRTIYYRQEGAGRMHVIYVVFDLTNGQPNNLEDLTKILKWWNRQITIPKVTRRELHGMNFRTHQEHNNSVITNIRMEQNTIYWQKDLVLVTQPNIESITLDVNESKITLKYTDDSNGTIELLFMYTGILTKFLSFLEL